MCFFLCLPVELWGHLCMFLNASDHVRLSRTCQTLRHHLSKNSTWYTLALSHTDHLYDTKTLETVLRRTYRHIRVLDVSHSELYTLRVCALMTHLQYLDVSHTWIRDLTPLRSCTSLQVLKVCNTHVRHLAPLSTLTQLHTIDLSVCYEATNTRPLSTLTGLRVLNLSKIPLTDISALSFCLALRTLDLSFTRIRTTAGLQHCLQLETLDLSCVGCQHQPLWTLYPHGVTYLGSVLQ